MLPSRLLFLSRLPPRFSALAPSLLAVCASKAFPARRAQAQSSAVPPRPNLEAGTAAARQAALDIEARILEAKLGKAVAEARAAQSEADAAQARAAAAAAEADTVVQRARAKAEAAAQRAKAEAGTRGARGTFFGRLEALHGQPTLATATYLAAVLAFAGGLVAHLWSSTQVNRQTEVTHVFERRRIDAIKARILASLPASAAAQSSPGIDHPFPRPEALKALEYMSTKAGIYMVVGPKGEGKSTLVSQFVSSHPHVLYVDLQDGSMDKAVRAVAAAIGYDMSDSTEEASARQHGYRLPELHSPQSTDMYETLLNAFETACVELRAKGELTRGCSPVLVLDHANRPLRDCGAVRPALASQALDAHTRTAAAAPAAADANLMYPTVEIGHRFANKCIASLVMVSSDQLQHAWKRAGGRDSVRYIRVAPFSDADGANLLSRRIFASRGVGEARPPTPEDLAAIQRDYSSTISTIALTLGNRARWLVQSLQHTALAPLTDAELAARGVPIPARYHPYLPAELRGSSLRVDPGVWAALQSLIEARKGDADALLNVATTFTLPPSSLSTDPLANRFAERILAVDAALSALLAAPVPHADLEKRFFASAEHVLRRLAEQHVVFYNHGSKDVEMESPLIHRVVTALLSSKDHELSVQLVRQLLAWQTAAEQKAELEQQMAVEGRPGSSAARLIELEHELDGARKDVKLELKEVEATRVALRELRR